MKGRLRLTMAINGRRNKPFGPGGGTRRLHQVSVVGGMNRAAETLGLATEFETG